MKSNRHLEAASKENAKPSTENGPIEAKNEVAKDERKDKKEEKTSKKEKTPKSAPTEAQKKPTGDKAPTVSPSSEPTKVDPLPAERPDIDAVQPASMGAPAPVPTVKKASAESESANASPTEPTVPAGGTEATPSKATTKAETQSAIPSSSPTKNPSTATTTAPTEAPSARPTSKDTIAPTAAPIACAAVSSCSECATLAKESINSKKSCWWAEDLRCKEVDQEGKDVNQMCVAPADDSSEAPTSTPKSSDATPSTVKPSEETSVWYDDESSLPMIVGVVTLLGLAFVCVKYARRVFAAIPQEANISGSRRRQGYEGVATNDVSDEEWGWEDEPHNTVGDVELSVHQRRPSPKGMSFGKPLAPSSGNSFQSSGSAVQNSKRPQTLPKNSWSDDSFEAAAQTGQAWRTDSSEKNTTQSTKLGQTFGGTATTVSPKKAPPPLKPREDDIFSSLGLSAKPTFSKPTAVSSTKSGSRWQNTIAPVGHTHASNRPGARSSILTANDDFDIKSGGVDWEDDADLDDLLNE